MILGCEMLDGGPLKECEEFRTEPPVPQVTQQKTSNTKTNDGERFTKKYVQQWIRVGTAKESSPLVLVCFSEGSLRSSRMAYQIPQSRDLQRRHDNLHVLMLTYIHWVLIEEASYYCGNRGMVKRIYCGVGMKTWEKKDDVLVDLVLWRSFCVMERGRLQIACKSPALESLLGPPISQDSLNTDDSRNRVCLVGYMSLQEEDNTWYRDCVRCFYCVVGLRTWEKEDDPWVEHVRWRSSCDYVRSIMGEKFVEEALARNSVSVRYMQMKLTEHIRQLYRESQTSIY